MTEDKQASAEPAAARSNPVLTPTMAIVLFALGLMAGVPLAIFGLDIIIDNAQTIFTILLAIFLILVVLAVLVMAFRQTLWSRMFRYGQVELDRFARPLSEVARFAAEQKVAEATNAAQEFAEMALARYSWVVTRRWLIASVTGFIAAIAAMAGSAILFQQNELLRVQNERITEQTALLQNQIELGEAQRSTSIVPEILAIGAAIGEETARLMKDGRAGESFSDYELSSALRARIVAASNAARPYRYLRAELAHASDNAISAAALARRTDVPGAQALIARWQQAESTINGTMSEPGALIDRPVSPERGQLISLLYNTRVLETEYLSFAGADFSFAEVRLPLFAAMSLKHALLRYADFSTTSMRSITFSASFLEGARFRGAIIGDTDFGGIPYTGVEPPYEGSPDFPIWRTMLSGADFTGALIFNTSFDNINGLAIAFDGAVIVDADFTDANLAASTFRNALIGDLDFSGAHLNSIDFDGAIVFDASFLENLVQKAVPGSFNAERFILTPIDRETLAAHPRAEDVERIDGTGQAQAYRVERVGAFE